jgi:hypothetical protein
MQAAHQGLGDFVAPASDSVSLRPNYLGDRSAPLGSPNFLTRTITRIPRTLWESKNEYRPLRSRFEHQIEGRLRGAAEPCESASSGYCPDFLLAGLSA